MTNLSRFLLTALRLAIGWHFLYEGLYKLDSDTGAVVHAPARYPIQAATARLRDFFQQPAWTLPQAIERTDAWNDELVKVFKGRQPLSEDQKARLNTLSDKIKLASRDHLAGRLDSSEIMNFDWTLVHEEVLHIAPAPEPERFTSLGYLQNSAGPLRPLFRGLVSDIDGLQRLTPASLEARLRQRHDETLHHFAAHNLPFAPDQQKQLDAARAEITTAALQTLQSPAFQTRLADYRALRSSAEDRPLHAPYTRERLDAARRKLDLIASELLAFVNEPLSEYAVRMQNIATPSQLAAGPVPRPADGARWVDRSIEFALLAIGACLLLGLFTPYAALAAAVQLLVFYLASPPWPHLPASSMAGHYLFIDRNFIEALAALTVAFTPAGAWASLDFYLRRAAKPAAQPEPEPILESVAR